MISLYISSNTWLHRIPASTKLLAMLLLSIAMLGLDDLTWLAIGLLAAFAAYGSIGSPGLRRLIALRSLLPIIIGIAIFQAFVMGWETALRSAIKLILMIMFADLITATTPMQSMLQVFQKLLAPLTRLLGFSEKKISLAVAMMIRFIPVLAAQWQQQQQAWTARTQRKPGFRLLVPFITTALARTDQVAEALSSRTSYSAGNPENRKGLAQR
jgi:biotin transport system permease protein